MGSAEEMSGDGMRRGGTDMSEVPPPGTWGEEVEMSIVRQVEFYLSRDNLSKDYYLKQNMNQDHWVDLGVIAEFPKMKSLGANDVGVLASTLQRRSKQLETSVDLQKVRPLFLVNEKKRSVLILREIPNTTPEGEIRALFDEVEDCPEIFSINPDVADTWFVTFDSEDGARVAFDLTKKMFFRNEPVRARVKNLPHRPSPGTVSLVAESPPPVQLSPSLSSTQQVYSQPPFGYPGFRLSAPFGDPAGGPPIPVVVPHQGPRRPGHNRNGNGSHSQPQRSPGPSSRGGGVPERSNSGPPAVGMNRVSSSRGPRPNPQNKPGRNKGKRRGLNEGGELRAAEQPPEKPKADVNLSPMNFPPLGGDEAGGKKEARDAGDKSSNSSVEKGGNDLGGGDTDEDKRLSRSSSESGVNGTARTYASIVSKSPKPQSGPSQPRSAPPATSPQQSFPAGNSSEPVESPSAERADLRLDGRTDSLRKDVEDSMQSLELQDVSAATASAPSQPSGTIEERPAGIADDAAKVRQSNSVWSNLPKAVLEAPSKTVAAKGPGSALQQ